MTQATATALTHERNMPTRNVVLPNGIEKAISFYNNIGEVDVS